MACTTCLAIISRSSSERCARLSKRAGTLSDPGFLTFSVLVRSLCRIFLSLSAPEAEFSGCKAALDISSAANSANVTSPLLYISENTTAIIVRYTRIQKNVTAPVKLSDLCREISSQNGACDTQHSLSFIPQLCWSKTLIRMFIMEAFDWLGDGCIGQMCVKGNDGPLPSQRHHALHLHGWAFFCNYKTSQCIYSRNSIDIKSFFTDTEGMWCNHVTTL